MKWHLSIVILATMIGGYLRFVNLGVAPFWCDEAAFATSMVHMTERQEYLPAAISHVLGVSDELRTRIPFALAGTLSIFAIYWVKPGKWSACASVFVAVFPLFVWWSRMCRPYAMAGLFMIFAWRYRWCMLPAILCTPVAIVGIDWFGAWKESKKKRSIVVAPIAGLIVMAGVMYLMRGDVGVRPGFGSVQMFLHEPRLWYLPIMAALMYITWYLLPWLE